MKGVIIVVYGTLFQIGYTSAMASLHARSICQGMDVNYFQIKVSLNFVSFKNQCLKDDPLFCNLNSDRGTGLENISPHAVRLYCILLPLSNY